MRRRIGVVLLCAAGSLNLLGCAGDKTDPEYQRQLKAFADAYFTYVDQNQAAPPDLQSLYGLRSGFPQVYAEIEAGRIVVIWSAELEQTAADNDKYVLAYEATVPQEGGLVVLGGGTVRHMSAEEFAKWKPFKKKTGKRE